jgi:hypothetical protein
VNEQSRPLAITAKAEISVLSIEEGPDLLSDGHEAITAEHRLVPVVRAQRRVDRGDARGADRAGGVT